LFIRQHQLRYSVIASTEIEQKHANPASLSCQIDGREAINRLLQADIWFDFMT